MGNSEVGHLNLGAGAVVRQDLVRIDDAIADGSLLGKRGAAGGLHSRWPEPGSRRRRGSICWGWSQTAACTPHSPTCAR